MTDVAKRERERPNDGIHPAIQNHYSGMNEALFERDQLRSRANELQNELAIARGAVARLENENIRVTKERDHYMRYSFALSTRINAMQDILNGIMDLAEHEADNPSPKQLPVAANIEQRWPKNEQD